MMQSPHARPRRPISGQLGANRGVASPADATHPSAVLSPPPPERRIRNDVNARGKPVNVAQVCPPRPAVARKPQNVNFENVGQRERQSDTSMCCCTEAVSYLRLIDSCITQRPGLSTSPPLGHGGTSTLQHWHASAAAKKCTEIARETTILVVREKAAHRLPVRRLII